MTFATFSTRLKLTGKTSWKAIQQPNKMSPAKTGKTPVKATQRTPTRRIESEEEPDSFAFDDHSDKDPPFKNQKEENEVKIR